MRDALLCLALISLLSSASLFGQSDQDVNQFRTRVGKVMTGTEEYAIAKTTEGIRLTGKSHTQAGTRVLDATHEQMLTPDLTLVRYKLVAGGTQIIEAWRDGQNVQIKVTNAGEEHTQTVPFAPPAIVLDNLVTAHFQVLLDTLSAKPSTTAQWTFIVPQAMTAVPGKVAPAGEEAGTLNGKSIRVQKYTLELASVLAEVWAESSTNKLMRVYVPVQDVEIVREGFALAPKPAPKTENAAAFIERAVEFPSGTLKFPATLCLPANAKGKLPLVVLVHGSGANDRDETIGPNKPFRDLAHGLAAAGIATLRYDKRNFAFRQQIDPKTFTVEEETLADAVAALHFARTLPEADAQRLFVLGHSQGAMFAPAIATRSQARGAIMMAAAERPLDQVIPEQIAFQLKLAGQTDQKIAEQVEELKKAFARVRSGEAKDEEVVFRASARYWRDYLKHDPLADLKALKAPVLVLQGGKDIQVRRADYDLALQALNSKPPAMREAHLFPNLNHLFLPVDGDSTGAEYGKPANVPGEVIQTIAAWINKQGGAK